MSEVKIQVLENGPLLVTGSVRLVDQTGQPISPPREGVIALCRCGGSLTKPFCDGTHSRIGFQGAIRAVQEAEAAENE